MTARHPRNHELHTPVVLRLIVTLGLFLLLSGISPASALIPSDPANGFMSADLPVTVVSAHTVAIPVTGSSVIAVSPHTLSAGSAASPINPQPSRVSTPNPAPVTPTPLRTPVLPGVVKRTVERPKVTVPLSLLVLLFACALGGLVTVAYLLVRRRSAHPSTGGKNKTSSPHVTVPDWPVEKAPEKISPSAQGPAVLFPPALEKKYLHPEFIGEGGLARVFRAQRSKDGIIVAVKVPIRFDEITGTHFTRDILFWQELQHKNIIRMYGSNILPLPYIEMEYARTSLAGLHFPLDEERALHLIQGIAEGLAYAHAHGIAHRDIKPENILLGEDGTPKITDWGLGKSITDAKQSYIIGYSPDYAAPEQLAPHLYGRPGPLTDIYQLGVLLYEMLIGTTPFGQEDGEDMNHAILYKKPEIPGWGGKQETAIKKIIRKCLEKMPADRYASVDLLLADLAAL